MRSGLGAGIAAKGSRSGAGAVSAAGSGAEAITGVSACTGFLEALAGFLGFWGAAGAETEISASMLYLNLPPGVRI
jgi:hypothetical protein